MGVVYWVNQKIKDRNSIDAPADIHIVIHIVIHRYVYGDASIELRSLIFCFNQ